jgi:hypothetical protein
MLKSHAISPNILVNQLNFEILLLVNRISDVKMYIHNVDYRMELIQLIVQDLIFLKINWLKIAQDLKHEVAVDPIFPGEPRVRDDDVILSIHPFLFLEVE